MKLSNYQILNLEKKRDEFINTTFVGLLRWLHAVDLDPSSKTFGFADREYWSWKTKDFVNATWQGGISGFLDTHHMSNFSQESIIKIVSANVKALKEIQRMDGSFEEAYPWESSVCVTALVIFNLLYSFFSYPYYFDQEIQKTIKNIVTPSYKFLERTPETHGAISNHTATIIFAKRMARKFLGILEDNKDLNSFLETQHNIEGWFPEYGGPDPGYQTLLNHYILAGSYALKELKLIDSIIRTSSKFVSLFCYPDGTYGGEIGSRGTSIVYPSGFLLPNNNRSLEGSWATLWFLMQHQEVTEAVTPLTVDGSNFVPVFNSWAFLLRTAKNQARFFHSLPSKKLLEEEHFLRDAGILVKTTKKAYLAISFFNSSLRKGLKKDNTWQDASLVALTHEGWTTQGASVKDLKREGSTLSWRYQAIKRKQVLSTPAKLMLLRILSICLFPFPFLQRFLKMKLVLYIMQSKKMDLTPLSAELDLADTEFKLEIKNSSNEKWEHHAYGFHKHMASANTFSQRQVL